MSAGTEHACALLGNGSVHCWGMNFFGQLGDGTEFDRGEPVQVSGLSNAAAISSRDGHTCALTAGGTVRCWGHLKADGLLAGNQEAVVLRAGNWSRGLDLN